MKTDRNIFVPCPRCVHLLESLADECPSCGLSLLRLDEQLGGNKVLLAEIVDPLNLISESESRSIAAQVEKLCQQISWLRVVVLTTHLPEPISLEEFLIWLVHRGVFEGQRQQETQGLIVLGVEAKQEQVGIAVSSQVYASFPQAKEKFKRLTEVFAATMQMVSPGLAIGEIMERMTRILIAPKSSHETTKAPY